MTKAAHVTSDITSFQSISKLKKSLIKFLFKHSIYDPFILRFFKDPLSGKPSTLCFKLFRCLLIKTWIFLQVEVHLELTILHYTIMVLSETLEAWIIDGFNEKRGLIHGIYFKVHTFPYHLVETNKIQNDSSFVPASSLDLYRTHVI